MPFLKVASAASLMTALLSACGGGVGTGPATEGEVTLTGTFDGGFSAAGDSVALVGYLTLELIEEPSGALTGGFALEATVDDGEFQQPIAGTGLLFGAVSPGPTALLHFTAIPDFCPSQPVEFTGTFNRRYGTLVVGGSIYVLDADCTVLLTFPSTISLSR